MKYCATCARFKPEINFHKQRSSSDGLKTQCNDCVAKYSRKYYRDNRDRINEYGKKYYSDNKIVDLKSATG